MNGMDDHEAEPVLVRSLRPTDLERVVSLDARVSGRRREEFFRVKLAQALSDTGIMISLAAELDGGFAGFCLARVYYGEFGAAERTAVLDTFDVDPGFSGRGVGRALLRQLRVNLLGLGIRHLRTEVAWRNQPLLSFFEHAGFMPGPRISLDLDLEAARRREETADTI